MRFKGGSFAPPLTAAKIEQYRQIADTASEQVAEIIHKLCAMVERYHEVAKPPTKGVVQLADEEVLRLWEHVPWEYEIEAYRQVLDPLPCETPEEKAVRNAAFHLLWYAVELEKDREPITTDRL